MAYRQAINFTTFATVLIANCKLAEVQAGQQLATRPQSWEALQVRFTLTIIAGGVA